LPLPATELPRPPTFRGLQTLRPCARRPRADLSDYHKQTQSTAGHGDGPRQPDQLLLRPPSQREYWTVRARSQPKSRVCRAGLLLLSLTSSSSSSSFSSSGHLSLSGRPLPLSLSSSLSTSRSPILPCPSPSPASSPTAPGPGLCPVSS
jgi:hypothetical protein